MKIAVSLIDRITYIYLSIALLIFLLTWLNPIFAIIGVCSLFIILKVVFQKLRTSDEEISISRLVLFSIIFVSFIYSMSAGIGGVCCQSSDWHIRNAIFRDLINFSFPVIYDNGSALIYYIGQFLPPALFGKICLLLGSSAENAFRYANWFNLFFVSLGIFLVILQLFITAKVNKFWIVLFLIFFSGMDILVSMTDFDILHLERHYIFTSYLQWSSNTTVLFWSYNQAIATWLLVFLFFRANENVSLFGFWGFLQLFYAPVPFLGLAVFLIVQSFFVIYKKLFIERKIIDLLKKIFSIPNILSCFVLVPLIYFYYKSNGTYTEMEMFFTKITRENIYIVFTFLLYEGCLLFLLMFSKYMKNLMFYTMIVSLIFYTFCNIDNSFIINLRATVPALFIFMLFTIQYLLDEKENNLKKVFILIFLLIGSITPLTEFYRVFKFTFYPNPEYPIVKDEIYTLNNKIEPETERCLLAGQGIATYFGNYRDYGHYDIENNIFWKYIAKRNKSPL